jgi:replicative DNA helicase
MNQSATRTERVSAEILDRLPPQSLEAERGVIGSLLLLPRSIDEVSAVVSANDFHGDANRRLFAALAAMRDLGKPIDIQLVVDELRRRGEYEAVGGAAYLAELAGSAPTAANAVYYATIVKDRSGRRAMIAAACDLLRDCWDEGISVDDLVNSAEGRLREVQTGRWSQEPVSMESAIISVQDRIDAMLSDGQHLGVPSGFPTFDGEVGGFFPGELTILAARTNIGKTSLAMQYAFNAARSGRRVYVATLEMSATELAMKAACCDAGVRLAAIRTGRINQDDRGALVEAFGRLGSLPVALHDSPTLRAYDIRRAARRFRADLIVVDYLTLLTPSDQKQKRYEQVGRMTKDLKAIARELHVPVIALAQLNRETEKQGKETRPKLIHLRECGDIEQDADCVLLLYRIKGKDFQRKNDFGDALETWSAELELAKGRLGVNHAVYRLDWDERYSLYREHGSSQAVAAGNEFQGDFRNYGGRNGSDF